MSWLLIRILFIQLWPVRASCWEIADLAFLGDELFVRLDIVLAEERQCMGWAVPDGEGECNTLGR